MVKKSAAELAAAWQEYNTWLKSRPQQGWEGMRFDVDGPEAIRPDIIETFPYWYSGSKAIITFQTDEFLSVCPWSGLPDFARLTIEYIPSQKCIELKSLKFYLYTWRNVGMYYEHIINKLLQDLVEVTDPVWMRIKGEFSVRGGLGTQAVIEYSSQSDPITPQTR